MYTEFNDFHSEGRDTNFCLLDHHKTCLKNLSDANDWLHKAVVVTNEDHEI